MPTLHGVLTKRIRLLSDFHILPRAYQIIVGIRTFPNVGHIKEKYNSTRVAGFLFLVIRLVINHHDITLVIVLLLFPIVVVQLLVTSFVYF